MRLKHFKIKYFQTITKIQNLICLIIVSFLFKISLYLILITLFRTHEKAFWKTSTQNEMNKCEIS